MIERVKEGPNSSEWHVYPGKYTDTDGCLVAFTFFCCVAAAICIPLWEIANFSGIASALWAIISFLAFGGASFWLRRYLTNRDPAYSLQPLLVILPDGIVQWHPSEQYFWLSFPNINRIDLGQQTRIDGVDGDISTTYYYWLDVFCSDGTYIKWGLNPCFGDPTFIGNTIIAAYRYYWRI